MGCNMKISELINWLKNLKDLHGDLPVYYGNEFEEVIDVDMFTAMDYRAEWQKHDEHCHVPDRIVIQ
jgi:hypothetical protein